MRGRCSCVIFVLRELSISETLWPRDTSSISSAWRKSVHVFGRLCASVALVPHYFRAERLLRRCSGGVARLPCRQRHLGQNHFWCVVPCRSTRVVEGLAWDRTPAPPLGARLARITGPGRRCTKVCVELTTGSPLSRGVSRCRSAHPATVICITVVVLAGLLLLH